MGPVVRSWSCGLRANSVLNVKNRYLKGKELVWQSYTISMALTVGMATDSFRVPEILHSTGQYFLYNIWLCIASIGSASIGSKNWTRNFACSNMTPGQVSLSVAVTPHLWVSVVRIGCGEFTAWSTSGSRKYGNAVSAFEVIFRPPGWQYPAWFVITIVFVLQLSLSCSNTCQSLIKSYFAEISSLFKYDRRVTQFYSGQ